MPHDRKPRVAVADNSHRRAIKTTDEVMHIIVSDTVIKSICIYGTFLMHAEQVLEGKDAAASFVNRGCQPSVMSGGMDDGIELRLDRHG